MSIRVIATLIVLAGLGLAIFLVLKWASGQNKAKRPPTPPGPYENEENDKNGEGLPWPRP